MACTPGAMAPRIVGPSAIPATTSPITRGCAILTASVPNSRATSSTTAAAMRKLATKFPKDSRCLAAVSFSPDCGSLDSVVVSGLPFAPIVPVGLAVSSGSN